MAARKLVTAFFADSNAAERAYLALNEYGIPREDVSVVASSAQLSPAAGEQSAIGVTKETKAPEGAATGAVVGGVAGALTGLLFAAGSLVIPGAGVVIAGPLVALLAGLGVGSGAGTLLGALIGAGIPEYEAKQIEDRLQKGGIVMAVTVEEGRVAEVRDVLRKLGGQALSAERAAGAT